MIKAIPKIFFSAAMANDRCSSSGAAAGSLLSLSRDTRYIDLARMRLAVLHKKYWLAIRNKEKLVDFRSGSCPIDLEAGDPILFALGVRHRRNGEDALVFALVSKKSELLDVDHAWRTYPREAEGCQLDALAATWGTSSIRCIPLDKDSIRVGYEYVNLSRGCLGFVHQIAHDSGVPHFCHADDLGKTLSITMPGGKTVQVCFRPPRLAVSECDSCDTRESRGEEKPAEAAPIDGSPTADGCAEGKHPFCYRLQACSRCAARAPYCFCPQIQGDLAEHRSRRRKRKKQPMKPTEKAVEHHLEPTATTSQEQGNGRSRVVCQSC